MAISDKEREALAAAVGPVIPRGQRVRTEELASVLSGDLLSSLKDVLENLPPAKPSLAALRTQLCAPALLFAKALYDTCASVWEMVDKKALSPKGVGFFFLGVGFMTVAAWAWGHLTAAYESAHARKDATYDRILRRVRAEAKKHGLDEEAQTTQ